MLCRRNGGGLEEEPVDVATRRVKRVLSGASSGPRAREEMKINNSISKRQQILYNDVNDKQPGKIRIYLRIFVAHAARRGRQLFSLTKVKSKKKGKKTLATTEAPPNCQPK